MEGALPVWLPSDGDDLDLREAESRRGHHDHEQQTGDGVGSGGGHGAGLRARLLDPPLEGTFVECPILEGHPHSSFRSLRDLARAKRPCQRSLLLLGIYTLKASQRPNPASAAA